MKPLRYAIFAVLFGVFLVVLTLVARTGQVDVSSIRPTPVMGTPMATRTPSPQLPDTNMFKAAMTTVGTQFSALAQNTDLISDEAWQSLTLSAMQTAEREARALAASQHPKHGAYLKAAEALRVTRDSLVDYDLIGMASGARLLNDAAHELK